jgi:hypothetical protein
MKKIIGILIFVMMCGVISAQTSNTFKYVIKANGGITNTKKGLADDKIDSTKVSGGYYITYQGADTLPPRLPASGGIDATTIYSKLQPDTVQHTSNYTVGASDWGKDQHLNKATSILVTLPPALTEWPIGGRMDFYSFGDGITVFHAGSGVTLISDTTSSILCATKRGKQDCSVKKIATSKYKITGPVND